MKKKLEKKQCNNKETSAPSKDANLVLAREKLLQRSRQISLVVLLKEELFLKS